VAIASAEKECCPPGVIGGALPDAIALSENQTVKLPASPQGGIILGRFVTRCRCSGCAGDRHSLERQS
jgi:hypothetical protein